MSVVTTAIIGFCILVFLIIILRTLSKGSLVWTLRGGVPMVDKAGTGKVCELIDYEVNDITKKVRLRLNYMGGKGIIQTGYWYDPAIDFYPSIDQVRWEDYMGTIICYKDVETGQKDYRGDEIRHLTDKFKLQSRYVEVMKKAAVDMLNFYEKQKVNTEQEKDVFKHSKALNAIKKLVNMGEEGLNDNALKGFGSMVEE